MWMWVWRKVTCYVLILTAKSQRIHSDLLLNKVFILYVTFLFFIASRPSFSWNAYFQGFDNYN